MVSQCQDRADGLAATVAARRADMDRAIESLLAVARQATSAKEQS
jgi:hypothetical protein